MRPLRVGSCHRWIIKRATGWLIKTCDEGGTERGEGRSSFLLAGYGARHHNRGSAWAACRMYITSRSSCFSCCRLRLRRLNLWYYGPRNQKSQPSPVQSRQYSHNPLHHQCWSRLPEAPIVLSFAEIFSAKWSPPRSRTVAAVSTIEDAIISKEDGGVPPPDSFSLATSAKLLAVAGGGTISPFSGASWEDVMHHLVRRVGWTDSNFEMLVFTDQSAKLRTNLRLLFNKPMSWLQLMSTMKNLLSG